MNAKPSKAIPLDGKPVSINLELPALVHLGGFGIIIIVAVVWLCCPDYLIPVVSILAGYAAYYTAFYTRAAINIHSHSSRVLDTINFSRSISDGDLFDSRDRLTTRFEYYYSSEGAAISRRERVKNAMQKVTEELKAQLNVKHSDSGDVNINSDRETRLIDDAIVLLDYFEDLAVGINYGVFDEAVAKDLLKTPLINFWNTLGEVVDHYRTRQERDSIYEFGEQLYKRWSK